MSHELITIFNELKNNPTDPYYNDKVLKEENKLYQKLIDCLKKRNYEDAEIILTILCMVTHNNKYRLAFKALINDRQGLKETTVKRGLSKHSNFYRDNLKMISSDALINSAKTESEKSRVMAEISSRKKEQKERVDIVNNIVFTQVKRALDIADSDFGGAYHLLSQINDDNLATSALEQAEKSIEIVAEKGLKSNNIKDKFKTVDFLQSVPSYANSKHYIEQLARQLDDHIENIVEDAYKLSNTSSNHDLKNTLKEFEELHTDLCEYNVPTTKNFHLIKGIEHLARCKEQKKVHNIIASKFRNKSEM